MIGSKGYLWMMSKATVVYGWLGLEIEGWDLERNRDEIAEALTGEWIESEARRRT